MEKVLHIYSDGGARGNPGPAAFAVMVCDGLGKVLEEYSAFIGATTNNVAEYSGLLAGLEIARKHGGLQLKFHMDSELVCRQMQGVYRVKAPELKKLFQEAKAREAGFERVVYQHVPRTHPEIKKVDRMLNHKLDESTL